MFTPVNEDGSAGETEVFAEGWIDENGEYLGRPVAVEELRDGSILVSDDLVRSEEHTSELQSLMRTSYAVFCLKKKNKHLNNTITNCMETGEIHTLSTRTKCI